MQVHKGGGVMGRLRQQQNRCYIEAGRWEQQNRRHMMGTAANEDNRREEIQRV